MGGLAVGDGRETCVCPAMRIAMSSSARQTSRDIIPCGLRCDALNMSATRDLSAAEGAERCGTLATGALQREFWL